MNAQLIRDESNHLEKKKVDEGFDFLDVTVKGIVFNRVDDKAHATYRWRCDILLLMAPVKQPVKRT